MKKLFFLTQTYIYSYYYCQLSKPKFEMVIIIRTYTKTK